MTLDQLVEIMQAPRLRCALYLPLLQTGMGNYGIRTERQRACFLATIGHESAALRLPREGWGPTPAQTTYERDPTVMWTARTQDGERHRNSKAFDLGNTEPGDGSRFRGRGLIQITGRANYAKASKALGFDYVADPARLELPSDATFASCWWWKAHGCNELAEKHGMREVTRRVNGGLNGYPERLSYYGRAYRELFGKPPDFSNVVAGIETTAPVPTT